MTEIGFGFVRTRFCYKKLMSERYRISKSGGISGRLHFLRCVIFAKSHKDKVSIIHYQPTVSLLPETVQQRAYTSATTDRNFCINKKLFIHLAYIMHETFACGHNRGAGKQLALPISSHYHQVIPIPTYFKTFPFLSQSENPPYSQSN